jgi:hypothetical protein
MVEHTHGHDKHNLNGREVDHIGLEKIKAEKKLHAINYNLNRYTKLNKQKTVVKKDLLKEGG